MNLRCYYCALNGVESIAFVTVHDKRGCLHCCWEHARWREKTSSAFGHHPTCPMQNATPRTGYRGD
jgi:hypothetical protein